MATGTVINLEDRNVLNAADRDVLHNALLIDNPSVKDRWNRPWKVEDGITEYLPDNCAWGIREVLPSSNLNLQVRITGQDKNGQSAMWTNCLADNVWTGWRQMDSSVYIEKGTFNSLASLSTILNTELGTMSNNEIRHIRLACNGSFDNFQANVSYYIDLKKSSMNYSSCMIQGVGHQSQISGAMISQVWYFEELVKMYKRNIATEVPTEAELKTILNGISGAGTFTISFLAANSNYNIRSSLIYSAASPAYGAGILFTYYGSSWYKVRTNNYNVTMTAF